MFRHTPAQEESPCETWREDGHLQVSEKPQEKPSWSWTPSFQEPWEEKSHTFCGALKGSPNKLIQRPITSQCEKSFLGDFLGLRFYRGWSLMCTFQFFFYIFFSPVISGETQCWQQLSVHSLVTVLLALFAFALSSLRNTYSWIIRWFILFLLPSDYSLIYDPLEA